MEIRQWIKNHKKDFVKRFIRDSGAEPNPDKPACIFMAGLPGAGKTEFTQKIITESNIKVVRIDMDEIATHIALYKPENADKFRYGASTLVSAVFDKCAHDKYPFIMDGTMSHDNTMQCISRCINKGYAVKITYIKQDPITAWHFTKARELVERRGIQKDGFIQSYSSTIKNLLSLKQYPDILVDIIIKDKNNKEGKRIVNVATADLDKYVKLEYNNKDLERILANE